MAKVKAILWVDEEILKRTYKEAHPDEEYSLKNALETEMGWIKESGIILGELEVIE